MKVSEELEGPYLEKLEQYEKRGELETRKLNDAKRQIEVLRLELSQKNKDLLTFEQDAQGRLDAQRKIYQTKLDSLQSDLEKNTQLAGTTTTLRQQVYERYSLGTCVRVSERFYVYSYQKIRQFYISISILTFAEQSNGSWISSST